jgi:hypothetical protein
MTDWIGLLIGLLFFVALILCVWLICRGCPKEDIFLTFQYMSFNQFDPSGWYAAGVELMKKKKYKRALACFQEVFKVDPCYEHVEDHIQTCEEKLYKDFEGW